MSTPKFLLNIDWSLLRNQKTSLLMIIRECDEDYPEEATVTKERLAHLQGILALIDAIQDYAVDDMGMNANDVFDFEQEEERGD